MIIGLTGYARSGKDEVAKILVEEYGYKRLAFADKIRELLFEMDPPIPVGYGLEAHVVGLRNYVEIYGWDEGKQNKTVRAMLQNLGVGARKTFGTDFWVAQTFSQVTPENNYVISDVRFQNEAVAIEQYDNSQIWRVERPGIDAINNHISERAMEDYSVEKVIKNEGTLDELRTSVRNFMGLSLNVN